MRIKIGVYVCHCGTNISGKVNVTEVTEFARTLPQVAVAREYKFMCSDPGQVIIQDDIKNLGLDRIVVAFLFAPHARTDVPRSVRTG